LPSLLLPTVPCIGRWRLKRVVAMWKREDEVPRKIRSNKLQICLWATRCLGFWSHESLPRWDEQEKAKTY
jgi:hypothetical protein